MRSLLLVLLSCATIDASEPDSAVLRGFLEPRHRDLRHASLDKLHLANHAGMIQAKTLEDEARMIDAQLAASERLVSEAWEGLRQAPVLPAPLDVISNHIKLDQRSFATRLHDLLHSVPASQWCFFMVVVGMVFVLDIALLKQLPEIARTHVCLLSVSIIVAIAFCLQVWTRFGQRQGILWASGYLLELIFSMENVFIFNLIFQTLETPRRLVRKALSVTLIGSVILRFAFALKLADIVYNVSALQYLLGAWLIYSGTQLVAVRGRCDQVTDVTQTFVVRGFRLVLGSRLGEFYDEEGEALIVLNGKQHCMTLLGAAVACLITSDFFFSADATLVKLDMIPNAYLSVSSSVMALFTLRAVCFVFRDILSHLSLARYCSGLILLFIGAEMMISRFTEVSALMSLIVIVNIIMLMAMFSAVKDSTCPKRSA